MRRARRSEGSCCARDRVPADQSRQQNAAGEPGDEELAHPTCVRTPKPRSSVARLARRDRHERADGTHVFAWAELVSQRVLGHVGDPSLLNGYALPHLRLGGRDVPAPLSGGRVSPAVLEVLAPSAPAPLGLSAPVRRRDASAPCDRAPRRTEGTRVPASISLMTVRETFEPLLSWAWALGLPAVQAGTHEVETILPVTAPLISAAPR